MHGYILQKIQCMYTLELENYQEVSAIIFNCVTVALFMEEEAVETLIRLMTSPVTFKVILVIETYRGSIGLSPKKTASHTELITMKVDLSHVYAIVVTVVQGH